MKKPAVSATFIIKNCVTDLNGPTVIFTDESKKSSAGKSKKNTCTNASAKYKREWPERMIDVIKNAIKKRGVNHLSTLCEKKQKETLQLSNL